MIYRGPRVTTGWVFKAGNEPGYWMPGDTVIYRCSSFGMPGSTAQPTIFRNKKRAIEVLNGVRNGADWRIVRLFRRVRGMDPRLAEIRETVAGMRAARRVVR